jgi:RimK family alpha-L-glutamate ligase
MKSFNELIEAKVETKQSYRLVVLVERPKKLDPAGTSSKLVSKADKLGITTYNCRINGAYLIRDEDTGVITIHNEGDDKGFELDADTIVFIRGDVTKKDSYMDLISQIERYGIACNNTRETIEVCCDKFRTYLRLQEIGMNQPKTVLIPNDTPEAVDAAHEALDNKFPMVLKTLSGSKGVGVLLIETERSLQSQISLIYKIDPYTDILLQEYIESDYDVRCVIVNKEIVGAMKRNKITDDFRSNASQGATVELITLTELEKQECLKAAKGVNGQWCGVDFIPAENRKTDAPYILEVNHSAGSKAISEALEEDITKMVLKLYFDRDIWRKEPKQCGVLETFEVDGAVLTGKLDTGNSTSVCSLHADDVEVKGKKVTWTMNGDKHSKPLHRTIELIKPAESRPVVLMDVEFLNTTYEVEVSLDKRNQIPFLVNRDFMQRANLMINPARKFMLTNKSEDGIGDIKK